MWIYGSLGAFALCPLRSKVYKEELPSPSLKENLLLLIFDKVSLFSMCQLPPPFSRDQMKSQVTWFIRCDLPQKQHNLHSVGIAVTTDLERQILPAVFRRRDFQEESWFWIWSRRYWNLSQVTLPLLSGNPRYLPSSRTRVMGQTSYSFLLSLAVTPFEQRALDL